jgi:hypothetical protein
MTVKVLYILSSGHSGSTLLGNVLGELDGFFHAGELRLLWRMGLLGDSRCGCGLPVRDCPLWMTVVREVLDGLQSLEPSQVLRWQQEALRGRPVGQLLRMDGEALARAAPLDRYADVVTRLYEAIARKAEARVVIDSTKREDNAALLHLLPGIEPFLVHLVRDPRAVIYSWQRRQRGAGKAHRLPTPAARGWVSRNRAAALIRETYGSERSVLVRYEDFILRPRETLLAIARMVGERTQTLPLPRERTVRLQTNHTAGGNRLRFTTGEVELRSDSAWVAEQRRVDRFLTTGLTLPALRRYGYTISGRSLVSLGG